jgi:hypothetical protein
LFEILQNLLLGYVDEGGEFYLFISKIRQMILSDMSRTCLGGVQEEFVPEFQSFRAAPFQGLRVPEFQSFRVPRFQG